MYRQINVNIIKEVLSFFEDNGMGEDQYHTLAEDEDSYPSDSGT